MQLSLDFMEAVRGLAIATAQRVTIPVRRVLDSLGHQWETPLDDIDLSEKLAAIGQGDYGGTSGTQDHSARMMAEQMRHGFKLTDTQLAQAIRMLEVADKGEYGYLPTDDRETRRAHEEWERRYQEHAGVTSEDLRPLLDLLLRGADKLKRPSISFDLRSIPEMPSTEPDESGRRKILGLRFKLSRCRTKVHIDDGGKYGDSEFFGYIRGVDEEEGNQRLQLYWAGHQLAQVQIRRLVDLIKAKGARHVVATYGMRAGECCFCGRTLENPQSVRAGFGETCARNYGLMDDYRAAR